MNASGNLRESIKKIQILPAMPEIAQEVLRLQYNYDQGVEKLISLIEKDPVILARLIGSANSPLFGTSRKITSVREAVIILGITHIKMMAMNFAMMAYKVRMPPGLLDMNSLWQHSLMATMVLHLMGNAMRAEDRPKGDEILLAGLLHDVGFLVLDYIDPAASDKFHARLAANPELSVEEAEGEMLDLDHCELGAELAKHWDLPEAIVEVLRYHNQPDSDQFVVGQPLARMVNMVEKLLPTFGNPEYVDAGITPENWLALGIEPEHGDAIAAKAREYVAAGSGAVESGV